MVLEYGSRLRLRLSVCLNTYCTGEVLVLHFYDFIDVGSLLDDGVRSLHERA